MNGRVGGAVAVEPPGNRLSNSREVQPRQEALEGTNNKRQTKASSIKNHRCN